MEITTVYYIGFIIIVAIVLYVVFAYYRNPNKRQQQPLVPADGTLELPTQYEMRDATHLEQPPVQMPSNVAVHRAHPWVSFVHFHGPHITFRRQVLRKIRRIRTQNLGETKKRTPVIDPTLSHPWDETFEQACWQTEEDGAADASQLSRGC